MPDWLKRLYAMASKGMGQMVTEKDNSTLDIKRIAGAGAFLFVVGAKAYDLIWRKGELDFMATCQGLAVVVGALSASIAINRNTENGG